MKVSENLGGPRLHAVGCLELEAASAVKWSSLARAAGMGNGTQSGPCSN